MKRIVTHASLLFLLLSNIELFSQTPLPPNIIRNSYMNIVNGLGAPAGYSTRGSVQIYAVHPFTKGFEGPYTDVAPSGSVTSVNDATQANPYWFGYYNKGPRASRGGLGDGFGSFSDGHILKITGSNAAGTTSILFPFERNVKTGTVHFRCWVKIVTGELIGFGIDAGTYQGSYWGDKTYSKTTTDAASDGWYYVDDVVATTNITDLMANPFMMTVKGDNLNAGFEAYIALPQMYIEATSSWVPSISDALSRDGLTIHPETNYVGIGTTNPGSKLQVSGGSIAASSDSYLNGFVQVWGDNALIWKNGNYNNGLRFGSADNLNTLNYNQKMIITDQGSLGLGTGVPGSKLQVSGGNIAASVDDNLSGFVQVWADNALIWKKGNVNNGLRFGNAENLTAYNYNQKMILTDDGKLGIGIANPTEMLSVYGNIKCMKLKVTQSAWPDYVFEPGYLLNSLDSVETYIRLHKHLPGVRSADEILDSGLDIGENQAILLKKIEELTLYMLQLKKDYEMKLAEQDKKMVEQTKKIELLENRLSTSKN